MKKNLVVPSGDRAALAAEIHRCVPSYLDGSKSSFKLCATYLIHYSQARGSLPCQMPRAWSSLLPPLVCCLPRFRRAVKPTSARRTSCSCSPTTSGPTPSPRLGNPVIQTPNLDRLVRSGVAFDRAYMQGGLQGATCVPSRAMLLSGRSLFRIDEKLLRDATWPAAFAGPATRHSSRASGTTARLDPGQLPAAPAPSSLAA